MGGVAGTGEDDVTAGLVADEPVGRLHHRFVAAWTKKKPERVIEVDGTFGHVAFFDELAGHSTQLVGLAEGPPHGEHHLDADVLFLSQGEHPVSCARVEQVEPDHHHVPAVVEEGSLQHGVPGVGTEALGYGNESQDPLGA